MWSLINIWRMVRIMNNVELDKTATLPSKTAFDVLRSGVRVDGVFPATGGDFLLGLSLTREAQDLLYSESIKRGISMEELVLSALEYKEANNEC